MSLHALCPLWGENKSILLYVGYKNVHLELNKGIMVKRSMEMDQTLIHYTRLGGKKA